MDVWFNIRLKTNWVEMRKNNNDILLEREIYWKYPSEIDYTKYQNTMFMTQYPINTLELYKFD